MIAYVYLNFDRRVPQSRSPLYQEVVKGIFALGEKKGFVEFDRSDKTHFLALLAKWMQDSEVYVVSLAEFGFFINRWITDSDNQPLLAHLRSCDQLHLRTEIIQSGFLRTNVDGDVEFTHPTFRAYFAALAISPEELPLMLDKNSWRTSLILWASMYERENTDVIVDLMVEHPILLEQIIRERAERREKATLKETELLTYFEKLNQFFNKFVKLFPVLLQDPPWSSLTKGDLKLTVVQSSAADFVLIWQSSRVGTNAIHWTTSAKLKKLAISTDTGFPLPMWILPQDIIQRYHPLEVVYLWVMRSLFDLLEFIGWEGGLDVEEYGQRPDTHPAVVLVTNRFLLYQEVASKLPIEFREQLPFYAHKEYDLGIEVHKYMDPPLVRYAVTTGHEPGRISIVPSILQEPDDTLVLFKQDEDGTWYFKTGEAIRRVTVLEEVDMGRLMMESPGTIAQNWLKTDLKQYLYGFPPQAW